jgi:hypothetical protein
MSYRNSRYPRRSSVTLTPAAELVGHLVQWRPKDRDGKRLAARFGTCEAYDAEARTLTLSVSVEANPWTAPTGKRTVTLPLSSGPFFLA